MERRLRCGKCGMVFNADAFCGLKCERCGGNLKEEVLLELYEGTRSAREFRSCPKCRLLYGLDEPECPNCGSEQGDIILLVEER